VTYRYRNHCEVQPPEAFRDPAEIEQIEEPTDSNVRVFQLKYLDVSVAAAILEQMFNDVTPATKGPAAKAPAKPGAGKEAAKPGEKGKPGESKEKEGEEESASAKRRREEEIGRASCRERV
jgi:hypothetical protein